MKPGNDMFDPKNLTKENLRYLGEQIEHYVDDLLPYIVFPDSITKEEKENYKKSIKIVQDLIEKLKKGKKSVFQDEDDWVTL